MSGLATSVPAEIATALDLAIDGDIFVLAANGEHHAVPERRATALHPAGPRASHCKTPRRSRPAVSINSLYVVDTGNSRIVQLAKSGQFERELVGVASPGRNNPRRVG